MFKNLKTRLLHFYEQHETRLEIAFFVGGFILDILLMSDVDDVLVIAQQAVYLFIIASIIHYETLFASAKWVPTGKIAKVWEFRSLIFSFLMGTLLNMYSLLYIKSASILNSILFLTLMIGLVVANELPVVKKSHVGIKVGLYGICLFSFFAILFPVIFGFIGWIPFGLAILATLLAFYGQFKWLKKTLADDATLFRAILAPGFSVLAFFLVFYFLGLIPPVPLSVNQQGIYHALERTNGNYVMSTEKPWWKFWQSGDQDFKAEPGDKIYFYAEIFSPARFSDKVYVHWSWQSPKGDWQNSDRIPLSVVGGRKEGYRGYAVKSNYQPGPWRVQVKSENGQEISRLYFDVTPSPQNPARVFTQVIR